MSIRLVMFVLAIAGSMTAVGEAWAKPRLWEVPQLRDGAMAAALAWEIGKRCDSIDVRKIQGVSFLMGLKSDAKAKGFSDDEIKTDLEEMKPAAYQELFAKGAVEGQPATYCAVGQAEIAANTQIGKLLK
ncbi:MAG: DUF5333 domain-containing protein [Deltaproteobacteria bacterium]